MKKYYFSLLYIILFFQFYLTAQPSLIDQVFQRKFWLNKQLTIPTTPEAATLGRFGENDFQVNKYTGAYSKSIPIYTIQGKELSLPISLNYNPNNVKVDNMPGWVGLGWSLNAGGSITRSVNAMPDLKANYFDQADIIEEYQRLPPGAGDEYGHTAGPPAFQEFLYHVIEGTIETQPDNYYYTAAGISGKFYITPREDIIEKQVNDVNINPAYDSADKDINSFSIKDKNGNTYNFDIAEETHLELADVVSDPAPTKVACDYNSTWHLSSISNANNTEKIIFRYTTESQFYDVSKFANLAQYQSKAYHLSSGQNGCTFENGSLTNGGVTSETDIKNRRFLSEIIYVLESDTLERVEFFKSDNPCPYADITSKKLDRIRVKRGDNGNVGILDFDLTYEERCTSRRLQLLKVQEWESSNTSRTNTSLERKEPYEFTYHAGAFPNPTTTFQMDHWGYFNGAAATSLIPRVGAFSGGGNRSTNPTNIKRGILQQINYPTGGYTTLKIEPHLVAPHFNGEIYGGGLRIEEIKNYDYDNTLLTKKTYKYVKATGGTSGKLLHTLDYARPSTYKHFHNPTIGGTSRVDYQCTKTILSATNRSQLGTVQDANVGYDRVECIIEANDNSTANLGKTIYHFKNKPVGIGAYENVANGLVEYMEIYDASGKKLVETDYEYSIDATINEMRNTKSFNAYVVTPKNTQDNRTFLCPSSTSSTTWIWNNFANACSESHMFETKFEVSRTYPLEQEWVYQSKSTEKRYFYNTANIALGFVETITNNTFGDEKVTLPTETKIVNSDGQEFKTIREYTHSTANAPSKLKLDRRHQVALPFVEEKYINNQLYYRTRIEYEETSTGQFYPNKFHEKFGTNNEIQQATINNFDEYGNVREAQAIDGQPSTQIWSNNGSRLSASVANASIGEVAYTSFETQEIYQGGWSLNPIANNRYSSNAHNGTGIFQPSGNQVITTIMNEGDYIISYYTNSPSSVTISGPSLSVLSSKTVANKPSPWHYVEHKVRLSSRNLVTLSVGSWIALDELRLYPEDALMTTYTYDKTTRLPVSIMDENSIPTHFEYDDLLRLTGVRNFDKHYLSVTEYLYKNQTNANNAIKNWTVLQQGQTNNSFVKNLGSGNVLKNNSYFDGIGRPLLSTAVNQSPTGKDIIQFQTYDKFGRQVQQYLPYTFSSNDGAFRTTTTAISQQRNFINTQVDFANNDENFAFAESELEASPLNRVLKQKAPGAIFNSHPTETKYQTNGSTEVRNFHFIGAWYAASSLYKTIQLDENGNELIVYTDKIGRKIMQDQEGSKTYFLYDNKNQLVQVIQPEAAEKGHANSNFYKFHTTIRDGSFLYTYDDEYRMKTKVIPGCQAYTYTYDDLDQLILTEDGNGFKTFTKYDKLGRPIMTGRYTGNATPTGNEKVYEERSNTGPHYYTTNQSFPTNGIEIYSVNYYDDYDINRDYTEEINYETTTSSGYDINDFDFVRGLPTASKVGILKNSGATPTQFLNSFSFYDQFRRVIHSRKDIHIGGTDKVWSKYNFPGWLLGTHRVHESSATNKTIDERWTYDHVGREKQYYHQVTGEAEQLVCEKTYNERDEVSVKKLGRTIGSNFLQTVDYDYNIRKWLTRINSPSTYASDLLIMEIVYNGASLGTNYNGNISSLRWKTQSDNSVKFYDYTYDNLNRLTAATYYESEPFFRSEDHLSTSYSYDLNGNIKSLSRNGFNGSNYTEIDNLTYNYSDDGALSNLTENSDKTHGFKSAMSNGSGNYTYDDNGNMLTDAHKGITVTYNFLNLPTKVTKTEGSIEWVYDAAGTKLSKTTTEAGAIPNHLTLNNPVIINEDHVALQTINSTSTVANVTFTAGESITLNAGFRAVSGADFLATIGIGNNTTTSSTRDYCSGFEYDDRGLIAIYFADGRVAYDGNKATYQYVLNDYQGNTRVLFKDNGKGVAEEIESYSYYPFGALHSQETDLASKYTFGGKELQTELDLGWSDFGTRCLDTWSGKWLGVDILAEAKPFMSPYSYGLGNPIRFSDPSGMIEEDQDGLMSVSTSLWGRDVSGGENTGAVLSSNFLSEGQRARDTETYTFNEYAGHEVSREVTDNGVDITYAGSFIGGRNSCCPTWVVNGARAALGFMAVDTYTPDPTDGFWPKWAAYAMGTTAAGAVLFAHSRTGTDDKPISITGNNDDSMLTLHRGVHIGHPDFANALNGMAVPRGLNVGSLDADAHNGGAISGFTSWSLSLAVANYHANKAGAGGVVLTQQFLSSQTFPSPDNYSELEILVPGIVTGARVSKPSGPGSPTAY